MLLTIYFLFAQASTLTEIMRWPNGPSTTVETDNTHLVFVANGSAIDILDVSNRLTPTRIGRILLNSLPIALAYQNPYLYVMTNSDGLWIFDLSNPQSPTRQGSFNIGDIPHAITVQRNYLFATYEAYDLAILDISNPAAPREVGQVSLGGIARGVFVKDTIAYVACDWAGLALISIANPAQPTVLSTIDSYDAAYDVYVQDGFAYVADYSGVEVFNVNNPSAPDTVKRLLLDGEILQVTGDGSDRIYLSALDGGIHEVDISNPKDIHLLRHRDGIRAWQIAKRQTLLFVASYNQGLHIVETGNADSLSVVTTYGGGYHALDITLSANRLYVADWQNGVYVVDWSNNASPTTLGNWPSYNASVAVAADGNVVYVADQQGALRQVDFSDPQHPVEIGHFDFGQNIAVNHVEMGKRFVYVCAGYNGWYALDRHQRGTLKAKMYWSSPEAYLYKSFVRNDTLALIAAGDKGLFILNIADTSQIIQLAHFIESDMAVNAVFAEGHYAYISNHNYLYVLDISDSTQPSLVGFYLTGNTIRDIFVVNNVAYIANSYNGLLALDVSDPANIKPIASFNQVGNEAFTVMVVNDTIYLAGGEAGVYALQWSTTGITKQKPFLSQSPYLYPAYPNPFNPSTTITFSVPYRMKLELAVFDVQGRRVATLLNKELPAGTHVLQWHSQNATGLPLSSGIYFLRLLGDNFVQTRRLIFMK